MPDAGVDVTSFDRLNPDKDYRIYRNKIQILIPKKHFKRRRISSSQTPLDIIIWLVDIFQCKVEKQ